MTAKRKGLLIILALLFMAIAILLFAATCNEPPITPTPSPTFPVSATPTDTPTATATTLPSPSPYSTGTAVPSSPTATYTPTPSPTGTAVPPTATSTPEAVATPHYVLIQKDDTYWYNAYDKYGRYECWQDLRLVNGWRERELPIGERMLLPPNCER